MNDIITFLRKGHRHKLIIAESLDFLTLEVTDVGYQLSLILKDKLTSRIISTYAKEELNKILENNIRTHPEFGKYIAVKNLGILLEPRLKIDFRFLIENQAKNNALFIEWKGAIEKDNLYFLTKHIGKNIAIANISYLKL